MNGLEVIMSIKGLFVLLGLVVVCVILSLFVNYGGLPPYMSYPLTIFICLAIGLFGGKYVE